MPRARESRKRIWLNPTEIARSCGLGDHELVTHSTLRGIVGIGMLFVGALRNGGRRWEPDAPAADTVFVLANPVAHGARLAAAVREALGNDVAIVADSRFAEVVVDAPFPGVSLVSLSAAVQWPLLRAAISARRRLPREAKILGSTGWVYRQYVFLAQSIRFALATEAVAAMPDGTIMLTDFDRSAYSWPLVSAANDAGLTTVTMFHGSPNAKNYVPPVAANAFSWGDTQRQWFAKHSPQTAVSVIGRIDLEAGMVEEQPLARVVICHSREVLSAYEAEQIRVLIAMIKRSGGKASLRLHPSASSSDLDARWQSIADLCDDVASGRGSLIESLSGADLVVSVCSTAVIDAIAIGVRGLVIASPERELPADLEVISAVSETIAIALQSEMNVAWAVPEYQQLSQQIVAAKGPLARKLLRDSIESVRHPPE